jgi:hypothetical protein
MNCCLPKTIKKEDVKCDGLNLIHEYNYSCYECLEKIRNRLLVYQGLKEVGILELIPPEDKKVDEELDRIEKLWDIYLKSISVAKQN